MPFCISLDSILSENSKVGVYGTVTTTIKKLECIGNTARLIGKLPAVNHFCRCIWWLNQSCWYLSANSHLGLLVRSMLKRCCTLHTEFLFQVSGLRGLPLVPANPCSGVCCPIFIDIIGVLWVSITGSIWFSPTCVSALFSNFHFRFSLHTTQSWVLPGQMVMCFLVSCENLVTRYAHQIFVSLTCCSLSLQLMIPMSTRVCLESSYTQYSHTLFFYSRPKIDLFLWIWGKQLLSMFHKPWSTRYINISQTWAFFDPKP